MLGLIDAEVASKTSEKSTVTADARKNATRNKRQTRFERMIKLQKVAFVGLLFEKNHYIPSIIQMSTVKAEYFFTFAWRTKCPKLTFYVLELNSVYF